LLLIVAVAAFFRLYDLGLASMRGDTIHFWNICRQPMTMAQIFSKWMDLGIAGQFPFPLAITKWFIDTLNLPVTEFTVPLPSALWGIGAVFVIFFAGRSLGTKETGLWLALLLALSTFHIQSSREAYFYPPLVLGACFALWGTSVAFKRVFSPQPGPAGPGYFVINAVGFALVSYSQPTGWGLSLLCILATMICEIVISRRKGKISRDLIFLTIAYGIIGLPLLLVPWAVAHLRDVISPAAREIANKAAAVRNETMWFMMFRTFTSFTWGSTPLRVLFSAVVMASGIFCLARDWRKERQLLVLPLLIVLGFVLFLVARGQAGALFESRYVIGILPAFLAVLALGIERAASVLESMKLSVPNRRIPALALGLGAVAFSAHPAYLVTQLTGLPAPYRQIVQWADSNLPQGTPIVVDRWFEPWNELKVYPSTNVFFTFTIPNEPIEVFISRKWRESAQQFWMQNPDAAYLEIAKEYWEVAGVGHWQWPRDFFGHSIVFTNEAGLKLRHLGLAYRGDYYWTTTNRVVVPLFYNTREDIIQKLAKAGVGQYALFGKGWGYTKTQDYRDWRILDSAGTIDLLNLTASPVVVNVAIRGVAVNSAKEVQITPDIKHTFASGKIDEWVAGPMELKPGVNVLRVSDPLYDLARTPLLVDQIQLRPAAQAQQVKAMQPDPVAVPAP